MNSPPTIFFACSGLGTTQRGYETFFASLFSKLEGSKDLNIILFKGGGVSSDRQKKLWNLPRRSKLAVWLGNRLGVGNPNLGRGYYIEQASFFLTFLPYLIWYRPAVVYFSDHDLGRLLARWKKRSGAKFTLVFRNGGAYPPPYPRFDYVQQVAQPLYEASQQAGCPDAQQLLLPEGFELPGHLPPLDKKERLALRTRLGLPADRPIILSVAALNASGKRLDYLVSELANLPEPRPYLVLLGQPDKETPAILRLCDELLGATNFTVDTVAPDCVGDYYRASDIFVLASVREGFGRVWVEALSHGLPCVAHDFDVPRYVLGEHGVYGDLEQKGVLADLLQEQLRRPFSRELAQARRRSAFERFSWERLIPEYNRLLVHCAKGVE